MHDIYDRISEDMYTPSYQIFDKKHELLNNSFANKLKQLREKLDKIIEQEEEELQKSIEIQYEVIDHLNSKQEELSLS